MVSIGMLWTFERTTVCAQTHLHESVCPTWPSSPDFATWTRITCFSPKAACFWVCVISYLLLWCYCRCWTVAPSAGQAVWWPPSPVAVPAWCQGGWPVCSHSVCLMQCHCALYLQADKDGRKRKKYDKLKTSLSVQFVLKCELQVKPGSPVETFKFGAF